MSAPDRLGTLLDAIQAEGGEWTTRRVQRTYQREGHNVPCRATARGDLALLHRRGHLVLDDQPNRRTYTPRTRGDRP